MGVQTQVCSSQQLLIFQFFVPLQIGMFKLSLLLLVFAIQLNVAYSEEDSQVDAEDAEDRRIRPPQIFGPCQMEKCQQSAECQDMGGKCCVYVPFNHKVYSWQGRPVRCRPKSKLPNLLTHCRCVVPK